MVELMGRCCTLVELLTELVLIGGCRFDASGTAEGRHRLERSGREPLMLRKKTADGKLLWGSQISKLFKILFQHIRFILT